MHRSSADIPPEIRRPCAAPPPAPPHPPHAGPHAPECERAPEVDRIAGELERKLVPARHDADDHRTAVIEQDRLANYVRITVESAPPECVADHRHPRAPFMILVVRIHSAQ